MPSSRSRAALAALSFALLPIVNANQHEPVRVGNEVLEAKLMRSVDPVYPEQARRAGISGEVLLQATIDEKGRVSDVKVVRGHRLLNAAAIEAVRQWQYSPALLNGNPMSVPTYVTLKFSLLPKPTYLVMNASGVVTEQGTGLAGKALQRKLAEGSDVMLTLEPGIPSRVVEESVGALVRSGVTESRIKGPCLVREGRVYYGTSPEVQPAEVAIDNERLAVIARERIAANSAPGGDVRVGTLLYRLYVNEVGEITGVERLRAPDIPELESELRRTRVVTPGRRRGDPVAVTVAVEVRSDPRTPARVQPR